MRVWSEAGLRRLSGEFQADLKRFVPVDAVDDAGLLSHVRGMTTTKLDLTGLKCPLPALKTRKALKTLTPGDLLEVHCTDPLSVIDIPNLIRETGDKVEITERGEHAIVFLIEKVDASFSAVALAVRDQERLKS
jgi:tRNA 2-thiouridine synthesizing protein A